MRPSTSVAAMAVAAPVVLSTIFSVPHWCRFDRDLRVLVSPAIRCADMAISFLRYGLRRCGRTMPH